MRIGTFIQQTMFGSWMLTAVQGIGLCWMEDAKLVYAFVKLGQRFLTFFYLSTPFGHA